MAAEAAALLAGDVGLEPASVELRRLMADNGRLKYQLALLTRQTAALVAPVTPVASSAAGAPLPPAAVAASSAGPCPSQGTACCLHPEAGAPAGPCVMALFARHTPADQLDRDVFAYVRRHAHGFFIFEGRAMC